MSCFNKVSTVTANNDLDLTKHVNYTSGMILGVDDFTQEFAYLAGRDRWLARDALGFGTISGLKVVVDKEDGKRPRVMVLPGVAVSPRGQLICVSTAQCAYLNDWLAANQKELEKPEKPVVISPPVTSPPAPPARKEVTLYVVLCYRDCPVDKVPIPGEPCRSEEELLEASRIQDGFSLELRLEAPHQPEEEKVLEFVAWLREIETVEAGASVPLADFEKAVLARWLPVTSPPAVTSPPVVTSPPAVTSPPVELRINVADRLEYLRAAFRLWATELRAALTGRKTGCAVEMTGGAQLEDCVLLAELRLPLESVTTGFKVSETGEIAVDEEKRPVLLHLRMLQEWLLGGGQPTPEPLLLDALENVQVPEPKTGDILIFDGSKWINKEADFGGGGGGGVTDHSQLLGLDSGDDHPQYLPVDGRRAMTNSLDAGGFSLKNVKAAANKGEALIFEQALKIDDEAKGDLSGKYPAPAVTALQGSKITPGVPPNNSVLMFKGGAWTPSPLPEPPASTPTPAQQAGVILPLATVTRVRDLVYEIWFNIDAPGNLVKVVDFTESQLQIHDETETAPTFLSKKFTFKFAPGTRNVFFCTLAMPSTPTPPTGTTVPGPLNIPSTTIPGTRIPPTTIPGRTIPGPILPGSIFRPGIGDEESEPDRMRFRFDISSITVEVARPGVATPEKMILSEFAEKNNIKFAGSLDGKVVTIFVRGFNG